MVEGLTHGGLIVIVVGAAGEAEGMVWFSEVTFLLLRIDRTAIANLCFRLPMMMGIFLGGRGLPLGLA